MRAETADLEAANGEDQDDSLPGKTSRPKPWIRRSIGVRRNFHPSAFLLMTQKIPPGSVAVTAHSPNRMDGSSASSVGMPKP
jgi:hypothetical protein